MCFLSWTKEFALWTREIVRAAVDSWTNQSALLDFASEASEWLNEHRSTICNVAISNHLNQGDSLGSDRAALQWSANSCLSFQGDSGRQAVTLLSTEGLTAMMVHTLLTSVGQKSRLQGS